MIDPGGDAAELRLELARLGATLRRDPDHARPLRPPRRRRRPRRGNRRAGVHARGRARPARALLRVRTGRHARPAVHARPPARRAARRSRSAGITFDCVAIPGHSPAHVAFSVDGHLFSGDLLFAGSVGRVDLPGADWDTLLDSVRTLADRYPPETIVYPGHGPQTTLGAELERNPFLAELRAARVTRHRGAARHARRPPVRRSRSGGR